MGYKTSEAYRDALTVRAESIGLHHDLAHECKSEAQQDTMLDLQKQVGFNKIVYEGLQKSAPQRPTRDYDAAKQKLDDLFEYARSTGDMPTWKLLKQITLLKKESNANDHRNRVKANILDKLHGTGTSKTRIDILLKSLMKYFDAYVPTQRDNDFFNGLINEAGLTHEEELEEEAAAEEDCNVLHVPRKERDF